MGELLHYLAPRAAKTDDPDAERCEPSLADRSKSTDLAIEAQVDGTRTVRVQPSRRRNGLTDDP